MHKVYQRVLVTPEFSRALLEVNTGRMKAVNCQQRRLDSAKVAGYERDLINGTFRYPQGDPLGFTGQTPSGIAELTLSHIATIGAV